MKGVHTCKPWTSKGNLCELHDSVEVQIIDDGNSEDYSVKDATKKLSICHPEITQDKQTNIDHYASPCQSSKEPRYGCGTVLASVGAYTVQCANCCKWRIVPTKEKYEELRQHISQEPFLCARACEWNQELLCDDPEDMPQDGSRVWAIDKPNIAQPPPGWHREVRLRGASFKFADVYYTSPAGKKLRSSVEIKRYLAKNPHYIREGVNLSQFSFAAPKPPQEDYGRNHTFGDAQELSFGNAQELLEFHEVPQVDPLCSAAPPIRRELLGGLGVAALDVALPHTDQPKVDPLCSAAPPIRKELLGELGAAALDVALTHTDQPKVDSLFSVVPPIRRELLGELGAAALDATLAHTDQPKI